MIKKLRKNEEAKARYRAVKIQPQWVVTPGKQTTHRLIIVTKLVIGYFYHTKLDRTWWLIYLFYSLYCFHKILYFVVLIQLSLFSTDPATDSSGHIITQDVSFVEPMRTATLPNEKTSICQDIS